MSTAYIYSPRMELVNAKHAMLTRQHPPSPPPLPPEQPLSATQMIADSESPPQPVQSPPESDDLPPLPYKKVSSDSNNHNNVIADVIQSHNPPSNQNHDADRGAAEDELHNNRHEQDGDDDLTEAADHHPQVIVPPAAQKLGVRFHSPASWRSPPNNHFFGASQDQIDYDANDPEFGEHEHDRGLYPHARDDAHARVGAVQYEPPSTTNSQELPPSEEALDERRKSISDPPQPEIASIQPATPKPETVSAQAAPRIESQDDRVATYAYSTYATWSLFVGHLVMFIIEFGLDGWTMESTFINPSLGVSYNRLDRLGGKITYKIVGEPFGNIGSDNKQGYRLVTSIFWFSGLIHFIPTVFALLWVGSSIEREYGPHRFAFIYLSSAIYGTIFSAIFCTQLLTVSGSAGLFGIVGARLVDTWLYRDWYKQNWLTYVKLVSIATIGIIIGLLPLIDNWAHIGALFIGAINAMILFTGGWRAAPEFGPETINVNVMDYSLAKTRRYQKIRLTGAILAIIAWIITVIGLCVLVRDALQPSYIYTYSPNIPFSTARPIPTQPWCKGCMDFQCVNTASWDCRPSSYYH